MFGRSRKQQVEEKLVEKTGWDKFVDECSEEDASSRVRFMRTLTRDGYREKHVTSWVDTFKMYQKMLQDTLPGSYMFKNEIRELQSFYSQILQQLFGLRFASAPDKSLLRAWWVLFVVLPDVEDYVRSATMRHYPSRTVVLTVKNQLLDVSEVVADAVRIERVTLAAVIEKPYKAVESMDVSGVTPDMDQEVQQLVEDCKTVISGLPDRTLSVEDAFFVEESTQTYIPEALKLLQQFAGSSPHLEEAAKQNVVNQLQLIHEKLVSISDGMHQKVLDELVAHEAFLQERITRL